MRTTDDQKKTNITVVLWTRVSNIQYIPRNMHTVFDLLCFVVVIHLLIFPYPSGLLHWHCGNLTIAPVPAKQPWWIWINTSCEFIMNDCITTTKQSTTKPCAYFLVFAHKGPAMRILAAFHFVMTNSWIAVDVWHLNARATSLLENAKKWYIGSFSDTNLKESRI